MELRTAAPEQTPPQFMQRRHAYHIDWWSVAGGHGCCLLVCFRRVLDLLLSELSTTLCMGVTPHQCTPVSVWKQLRIWVGVGLHALRDRPVVCVCVCVCVHVSIVSAGSVHVHACVGMPLCLHDCVFVLT